MTQPTVSSHKDMRTKILELIDRKINKSYGTLKFNESNLLEELRSEIEKMDEWIPVTERLPDTDEPVFTYCNGVPTIATKTYSGEWVEAYDYEGLGNNVKFWMHLPPNN